MRWPQAKRGCRSDRFHFHLNGFISLSFTDSLWLCDHSEIANRLLLYANFECVYLEASYTDECSPLCALDEL